MNHSLIFVSCPRRSSVSIVDVSRSAQPLCHAEVKSLLAGRTISVGNHRKSFGKNSPHRNTFRRIAFYELPSHRRVPHPRAFQGCGLRSTFKHNASRWRPLSWLGRRPGRSSPGEAGLQARVKDPHTKRDTRVVGASHCLHNPTLPARTSAYRVVVTLYPSTTSTGSLPSRLETSYWPVTARFSPGSSEK
jgi:hypothetical protein